MQRFIHLSLIFISLLIISACSSNTDEVSTASSSIRVAHLSSDTTLFNVRIGTANDKITALSSLSYGRASAFIEVAATALQVEALNSFTSENIFTKNINLAENSRQTLFLVNAQAQSKVLSITDNNIPAAGKLELRVVHAAPTVASSGTKVDVFITTNDIELTNTVMGSANNISDALANNQAIKLSDIEFETIGDELTTLSPGNYRIRITEPGTPATVIYDSGELSFTAAEYIINIIPALNSPTSILALSILSNDSDSPSLFRNDARVQARAAHLASGTGNIDVLLNDEKLGDNIAYRESNDRQKRLSGTNTIKVNTAGTMTELVNSSTALSATFQYSVLILNNLTSLESLLVQDFTLAADDKAQLRIVHAAPLQNALDVYIQEPSVDINSVAATFSNMSFKKISIESSLDITTSPQTYRIQVTLAGSKVAIFNNTIALEEKHDYIVNITESPTTSTDIGLTVLSNSDVASKPVILID